MPRRMENIFQQRFGKLYVYSPDWKYKKIGKRWVIYWPVQCDCGKKFYVLTNSLKSGSTKSCGCSRQENPSFRSRIILHKNQVFSNRTVIDDEPKFDEKRNNIYYLCKCNLCGAEKYVRAFHLLSGTQCRDCFNHKKHSDNAFFGISQGHLRIITAFGESKSVISWSGDERCSVTYVSLRCRLLRGWNPEKAISQKNMVSRNQNKETQKTPETPPEIKKFTENLTKSLAALAKPPREADPKRESPQ